MREDEKQLAEQIRQGNPQAERKLLSLFSSRIARKVMYEIGVQTDDWKDVVNDILLALLQNLRGGKFDTQRGIPLGSYVYGIVRNKISDYFKFRKKQLRHQPLDQNTDFGVDEKFELEKRELRTFIKDTLKELKQKYRQVLYLKYYEEMSIAEISKWIGLPPRRVSERLNYAIKLLGERMKKKNIFNIY